MDSRAIVDVLFNVFLDREPDAVGASHYEGLLDGGTSALELAFILMGSQEFNDRQRQEESPAELALDNRTLVRALFHTLLGRQPDAVGASHYSALLDSGTSAAELAFTLMGSEEFIDRQKQNENPIDAPLNNRTIVRALFHALLGRQPDAAGVNHYGALLNEGFSPLDIVIALMGSQEFVDRQGDSENLIDTSPDSRTIVRALFHALLGRQPDAAGMSHYSALLDEGGSPLEIVIALMGSQEFIDRQGRNENLIAVPLDNRTIVRALFHALLGRQPDAVGMRHYVSLLDAGSPALKIVATLMASREFIDRQRQSTNRIEPPLDSRTVVRVLFSTLLGRRLDQQALDDYALRLDEGRSSSREIALDILGSHGRPERQSRKKENKAPAATDTRLAIEPPLIPRVLGERLTGLKVLLLGTCQLGCLLSVAPKLGFRANQLLYESARKTEIPALDPTQTDAVVVGLSLRHILMNASGKELVQADMSLARLRNAEDLEQLVTQCMSVIAEDLRYLHTQLCNKPTFFLSFLEPSFNYLGNLVGRHSQSSPLRFVRRLNREFNDLLDQFPNFHFIDSNEAANLVGRMHLRDDGTSASTHASFINDFDAPLDENRLVAPIPQLSTYQVEIYLPLFNEIIWNIIADNLKILRRADTVKLIVLDLDDTLWRGVAADGDLSNWAQVEGWPLGFVEALLFYKRRGGLLAICSKNDHDSTMQQLQTIWHGAITADDFVSIKINWQPKPSNIAEILEETNLLPSNVAFIDDNPREIDEVRAHYPDMRFFGVNHYEWRRIILQAPEMQVPVVTAEAQQRTELVRARVSRDAAAPAMSRDAWLRSLELEQRFFVVTSTGAQHFQRAFELINKTNQFNTTGKRWNLAEMVDFFDRGGVCLLTSLRDKSVDNGIIGAALIKDGEIVQAVLSCRVFGLGAELAMGRIATEIALVQAPTATGSILDTGKNLTCHGYFVALGFQKRCERFEISTAPSAPAWIRLVSDIDRSLRPTRPVRA